MLSYKQFQKIKSIKKESLGKKRYKMPQIHNDNLEEFKSWLDENDIKYEYMENSSPNDLKATQCEFNCDKIESILSQAPKQGVILASSDNRVIDGHHRWIAAILDEQDINTLKIDQPIDSILKNIKNFKHTENKKLNENWRTFFEHAFSSYN